MLFFPSSQLALDRPQRRDQPSQRRQRHLGSVTVDKQFYALDAKIGKPIWSYETGHWIRSQPAVANGVVYFGSFDDVFYALDAETGEFLWSYQAHSAISSGPAVVNGMIYMTSWDGSLYAFGPED